jgi:hypothetical protein
MTKYPDFPPIPGQQRRRVVSFLLLGTLAAVILSPFICCGGIVVLVMVLPDEYSVPSTPDPPDPFTIEDRLALVETLKTENGYQDIELTYPVKLYVTPVFRQLPKDERDLFCNTIARAVLDIPANAPATGTNLGLMEIYDSKTRSLVAKYDRVRGVRMEPQP